MGRELTVEDEAQRLQTMGYRVKRQRPFDTAEQYGITTPEGKQVVMNYFHTPGSGEPYLTVVKGEKDPNLPEEAEFVPVLEVLAQM